MQKDHRAEERMRFIFQMRQRGIRDLRVMRALELVPREYFVEPDYDEMAYADQALPIECGQTISQPYVVAAMSEALNVEPHHKVLEIGTGSGYQAAVLAHLADRVVTVERYRTLADQASERLHALGLDNVKVILGDGTLGAPDERPFDRIMVTAAAGEVPQSLLDQLKEGGYLIAPLGPAGAVQTLVRIRKKPGREIEREDLMAVRFVPLVPGRAAAS
jgi:protein-L-isoaspartate(D-aspartate) O-methyltransferase